MKPKGTSKIDIEGLENLERGTGVKVGEDTSYDYAGKFETEGMPLIDPGTGKTVSIRTFTYKIDPKKVRSVPDNKQQIFNDHAGFIRRVLWGDGLVPLENISPRVIINKKKLVYQIFVPCEARLNTVWADKPQNLSHLLAKEAKEKQDKKGKLDSHVK